MSSERESDGIAMPKPTWETKPGSPEFRLSKVDDRATVDVGQPHKFGGKLGPGWRSEKWGGRGWMSVFGYDVKLNKAGKLKKHPKYQDDIYECECLRKVKGKDRAERHIIVPGSTEYVIEWDTIADVPDTGYVDLELEFSGDLTWHKQLPLTQEMIDLGHMQPENVVNSYAVYGSTAGRYLRADGTEIVNYETGKFCHVYRPQLIDANGNTLWCDQTAPLAGPNRLRSYLDLAWLADATFPVRLDPTFGHTSVGASGAGDPYISAVGLYAPAGNGTLDSISLYMQNGGSYAGRCGLYANSSNYPGSLVCQTEELTPSQFAFGWRAFSDPSTTAITGGTNYFQAFKFAGSISYKYDSASGKYWKYGSHTYTGNLPNPYPSSLSSYDNYMVSIYATYTEAASGNPYYAYAQQ